ncbi:hypothetical protein KW408_11285 [Klebsiella variicola]|uniref:hypothetical protein n=1 Tax=Klebsiella variicola TaxID=244366 RepID=UPI001C46C661|nr:hypothetical protein [Klebsiella variicola]QXO00672.1 hypothetical protein KW408_11285 [Klebsiella variicola]
MFNVTLKNQQIDIYLNGYRISSERRDISVAMEVTRVYGLPDGTLNAVVEIITDEQSIPLDWPPESPDNQYHLNK